LGFRRITLPYRTLHTSRSQAQIRAGLTAALSTSSNNNDNNDAKYLSRRLKKSSLLPPTARGVRIIALNAPRPRARARIARAHAYQFISPQDCASGVGEALPNIAERQKLPDLYVIGIQGCHRRRPTGRQPRRR